MVTLELESEANLINQLQSFSEISQLAAWLDILTSALTPQHNELSPSLTTAIFARFHGLLGFHHHTEPKPIVRDLNYIVPTSQKWQVQAISLNDETFFTTAGRRAKLPSLDSAGLPNRYTNY